MFKRVRVAGVAASLLMSASAGAVSASASPHANADSVAQQAPVGPASVHRGATLASSAKQVTEGDRYTLTATIKATRQASKVTLQKYHPSLYGWDDPSWEPVKTVKVRDRSKVKFGAVATGLNTERYRAVVSYKTARPFISKPANITVWRWIPLSDYDPYYESEPYSMTFGTTTINGQAYNGWGPYTYSHTGTWEARFTPGRHCTSFRAVVGLADISADESTGAINFTADDTVIYQSPTLTPGMSLPVTVPLAEPYRFGIQLFDTTPGGTTGRDAVESWPVIGDPALLCTGV